MDDKAKITVTITSKCDSAEELKSKCRNLAIWFAEDDNEEDYHIEIQG